MRQILNIMIIGLPVFSLSEKQMMTNWYKNSQYFSNSSTNYSSWFFLVCDLFAKRLFVKGEKFILVTFETTSHGWNGCNSWSKSTFTI